MYMYILMISQTSRAISIFILKIWIRVIIIDSSYSSFERKHNNFAIAEKTSK